jgi:hypothetical protein
MNDKERVLFEAIRDAISKDVKGFYLKQPQVKSFTTNRFAGYCYVASEAFFHMINCRGYKPMFLSLPDDYDSLFTTHWFILSPDSYMIDLTAEQFKTVPPYELAIEKGFLTKKPCKRTKALITSVEKQQFSLSNSAGVERNTCQ